MNAKRVSFSGILLAGGKSERMGSDKAFLKFGNQHLYKYSLAILEMFCNEIIISSSDKRFADTGWKCLKDEIPGKGPIGGLFTCLKEIKNERSIVLPVDLPFVPEELIEILIKNSGNHDITVPYNKDNFPEPLTGIYSRGIIPLITRMLDKGNYKLMDLLTLANTNIIRYPGAHESTWNNINTTDDFAGLLNT